MHRHLTLIRVRGYLGMRDTHRFLHEGCQVNRMIGLIKLVFDLSGARKEDLPRQRQLRGSR